jgi:hypothetical protein
MFLTNQEVLLVHAKKLDLSTYGKAVQLSHEFPDLFGGQ